MCMHTRIGEGLGREGEGKELWKAVRTRGRNLGEEKLGGEGWLGRAIEGCCGTPELGYTAKVVLVGGGR